MVIQLLFKLDIRYFTPYYQSDFILPYIVHMFLFFFTFNTPYLSSLCIEVLFSSFIVFYLF